MESNSFPENVRRQKKQKKQRHAIVLSKGKKGERERGGDVEKKREIEYINVNEIYIHGCLHRNPFTQFETLNQISHL